ncbi:MAG TPA: DUF3306 domain-containing protein [Bradyrhizobium sp.]|nr:DUF3306 domain-containing protein [Bradyrhizobium sp.]
MSEEEFLARWSRRKREARAAADGPQPAVPAEAPNPAPSVAAEHPVGEEVDLSSLPPIDSITAATDITAYLRNGIPQELGRAALRRAWSADPAIRDFVGLAENAWDFNDPNAMPGFGPLDFSEQQLSAVVERIVGGVRRVAQNLPNSSAEPRDEGQPADSEPTRASHRAEVIADRSLIGEATTEDSSPSSAAPQREIAQNVKSDETVIRRRTHGGALPR